MTVPVARVVEIVAVNVMAVSYVAEVAELVSVVVVVSSGKKFAHPVRQASAPTKNRQKMAFPAR